MAWLIRLASDETRIENNISRLEHLQKQLDDLSWFVLASQSGGFTVLQQLADYRIVRGRPPVYEKLQQALFGENNQKVALDAPTRCQRLIQEAAQLVQYEISKERRNLAKLHEQN